MLQCYGRRLNATLLTFILSCKTSLCHYRQSSAESQTLPPSSISQLDNNTPQTSHHSVRRATADSRYGEYGNNGSSPWCNPPRSPDAWPSSLCRRLKWNDWARSGKKKKKRGIAVRWSEAVIYLRPQRCWPSFKKGLKRSTERPKCGSTQDGC